jgi:hypothetical protein
MAIKIKKVPVEAYNSVEKIKKDYTLLLLVSLGIPTRVGQNRSQPVFAS